MENLTFDQLVQAWNAMRMSTPQEMSARVPGLTDPRALVMSRVSETPFMLTVMFRGFDQALSDMERGMPLAKRFMFDWVKRFGQAQIQRGDDDSMIVRITKPARSPMEQPAVKVAEARRAEAVAHIANVRNLNGY